MMRRVIYTCLPRANVDSHSANPLPKGDETGLDARFIFLLRFLFPLFHSFCSFEAGLPAIEVLVGGWQVLLTGVGGNQEGCVMP